MPVDCDATREPSKEEFLQHLNEMPVHGALYVSLTPWYGKLAAFSTAFVNFDFYFQAGVSFAQLKSSCDDNICDDMKPGLSDDTDPNNVIAKYGSNHVHAVDGDYVAELERACGHLGIGFERLAC